MIKLPGHVCLQTGDDHIKLLQRPSVSNLLIIKNLESKILSVVLYTDYRNSNPFGIFSECVISTAYTDIQN